MSYLSSQSIEERLRRHFDEEAFAYPNTFGTIRDQSDAERVLQLSKNDADQTLSTDEKQDRSICRRSFAKQPIENIAHSNNTSVRSSAVTLSQYLVQGKQTYKNTSLANLLDFGVAFRRLGRWLGLKRWRQILASEIFLRSLDWKCPMLPCYMPIAVWCQNCRRSLVLSSWFSVSVLLVSTLWSRDRSQYGWYRSIRPRSNLYTSTCPFWNANSSFSFYSSCAEQIPYR